MTTSTEYMSMVEQRLVVDAKPEFDAVQEAKERLIEINKASDEAEAKFKALDEKYQTAKKKAEMEFEAAYQKAQTLRNARFEVISAEKGADKEWADARNEFTRLAKEHEVQVALLKKAAETLDSKKAMVMQEVAKNIEVEIVDAGTLRLHLKSHGITIQDWEKLELAQAPFKNGVAIYRRWEEYRYSSRAEPEVSYYAVLNGRIVGYQMTRRSEHAGDEPVYHAFMGNALMLAGMQKAFKRYTDWKEKLKEATPEQLVPFDMTNKKNRELLGVRCQWYISEN